MNQSQINKIISELAIGLRNKQSFGADITDVYIDEILQKSIADLNFLPNFSISSEEIESIKFSLGSMFNIKVGEEAIVLFDHDNDIARWFDARKSEIDWKHWDAYKDMLESQARPVNVISSNERVIDTILDLSGNPLATGPWNRKGLVMGNVQSGKTQNYLGLINKAIDSGYKVIILLGGHLQDLRKQTQERVDEGVIGLESKHINKAKTSAPQLIGVGNFRKGGCNVHAFTTTEGDFTKKFANSLGVKLTGLSEPAIFTVKKNTVVLNSLYEWIKENHLLDPANEKKLDLPMLLIDDEADYASVNTKAHKDEVTKTNESIRKLLSLFNRSTYVGYTATPFANIFIDPDTEADVIKDDLFPRDFMVKIPVPENYIGQDFYFGEDTSSTVVINDYEPFVGLMSDSVISHIPESLKQAIRSFVLVVAIRHLRGDKNSHNTMLVNISHLKIHHIRMEFLISEYMQQISDALTSFSKLGVSASSTLQSLKKTFEEVFNVEESYEEVFDLLQASAGKIKIWAINQTNKKSEAKALDYSLYVEYGLCAIVIGGHKLSRGLTLEGLSISYFTRNSKAYDTLMQMCRWFGYRPRYQDLCRVYLPYESLSWYSFISASIRELYGELDLMCRMEKRPSEFGLKVREHPGAMIITAKNKMGSADSLVRTQELWGQVQRRFRFKKDPRINEHNLNYAERFLKNLIDERKSDSSLIEEDPDTGVRLIKKVSYQQIINFIENIDLPEDDVGNSALIKYLRKMDEAGLEFPQIIIYNQKSNSRKVEWATHSTLSESDRLFLKETTCLCGMPITMPKRAMKSDGVLYSTPSVQLGNPDDEKLFLSKSEQNVIKALKEKPVSFDYICSKERDFPGLIIYLFAVGIVTPFRSKNPIESVQLGHGQRPTLGYSISLPRPESLSGKTNKEISTLVKETRHSYQVNKIYQEQLSLIDLYEDEGDYE